MKIRFDANDSVEDIRAVLMECVNTIAGRQKCASWNVLAQLLKESTGSWAGAEEALKQTMPPWKGAIFYPDPAGHPDCPYDEPFHDHGDGCPSCHGPEDEVKP